MGACSEEGQHKHSGLGQRTMHEGDGGRLELINFPIAMKSPCNFSHRKRWIPFKHIANFIPYALERERLLHSRSTFSVQIIPGVPGSGTGGMMCNR